MIWDPLIRIFHWSLAATFLLNYFVTEEGGRNHEWVGYTAVGLLAVRIVWGFIGPRNARFSSFFPTPRRVRHHLAELRDGHISAEEGHNPLGGAMVLLLMALMLSLGVTGYMMEEIDVFFGEEWLEELHETLANITLIAVVVHVSAVVLMQRRFGIDLVRPMVTGRRTPR